MNKLAERYRLNSFIIQGEVLKPPMSEFVFSTDGTYVSGTVAGSWSRTGDLVRLTDRFAAWGEGKLSDQGRLLTFQYEERGVEFYVILNSVQEKKP